MRIYTKRPLVERFWEKVDKRGPDDCWPWTGATRTDGYGVLGRGGRGAGLEAVHRVSWTLHKGPIPKRKCVLHRCDHKPCCNPRHLWLGTKRANSADMVAKGRSRQGTKHHACRLTVAKVRAIRKDPRVQTQIAAAYGISQAEVSMIKTRKHWDHVA